MAPSSKPKTISTPTPTPTTPKKNKQRLSGKEVMDLVGRKLVFSSVALALGLLAFWQTQRIVHEESFQATGKACERASASGIRGEAFLNSYHDYVPLLGGSFACIMTQFLHRLVVEWPAGFVTWAATLCTLLPAIVVVVLEAGRVGAVGPLRFPTLTLLLVQLFGAAVVLPGLWVPSYLWGRPSASSGSSPDDDPLKGALSHRRAVAARFLVVPAFVGTASVFVLNPASYAWTVAAGAVGGPLLGLVPLVCWRMHPPPSNDDATLPMVHAAVTSYSIAGTLSFLVWAAVMATVVLHYRFDYQSLIKDCWTEAHGFVRFMTIDAVVLYLGMLTYVGYVRMSAVAEVLLQTVFFGPGAALAATMATLEMERSPLATPRRQPQQQETEKRAKND